MTTTTKTQPAAMAAPAFSAYFPLVPHSKKPAVKNWEKTEPGQQRLWQNAGINLQPKELIVDVDLYKPEGAESLKKLKAKCPELFDSYTVKTPRGGMHFYATVPGDRPIKQRQSEYPGVEFQNGAGTHRRYAVAPGSVTPDGAYEVVNCKPVIELPKTFLGSLDEPIEQTTAPPMQALASLNYEQNFIEDCRNWPAAISGEGGSNVTFALAARGVRDYNLPAEAVLRNMWETYNPRCQPPWTYAELRKKVNDAYARGTNPIGAGTLEGKFAVNAPDGYLSVASELLSKFPQNHHGNAARLAKEYGQHLRWCKPKRSWFIWNGKYWEIDNKERPTKFALGMVQQMYQSASTDEERKFAYTSGQAPSIRSTLELAKAYLPITTEELDCKNTLLNCRNGTVDLNTGELNPHNPNDYITKYIDVDFLPTATAPNWEKFLADIFPENSVAQFVQRAVGSAISGEGTIREQKLFIAYGDGQNGKSTFFNALHDVLGGYSHETDHALLIAAKQRGPNEGMSNLRGVRLATTIETSEDDWLNETTVKHLTGGDLITCDAKYEKQHSFKPTHTLFMVTNHLPGVKSQGFAVWRRILTVPFTQRISEEKKDVNLFEKLKGERSGILAWLVHGHKEWKAQGLMPPESVLRATDKYKAEQDSLAPFLDSMCEIGPGLSTQASQLFLAYKSYCGQSGIDKPLNKDSFPRRIGEQFQKSSRNGRDFWIGIGLKQNSQVIERVFSDSTISAQPATVKTWEDLL